MLAHIQAAAPLCHTIVEVEDMLPAFPVVEDVPVNLETKIESHAQTLMCIAREIRAMHESTVIAICFMHKDISKLNLRSLIQTNNCTLALAYAHSTYFSRLQRTVGEMAGGIDLLQGAVCDLENRECHVHELEGQLRGNACENEQLRENKGRAC